MELISWGTSNVALPSSSPLTTKRKQLMQPQLFSRGLLGAALALGFAASAAAQVSFTQNFDLNSTGWTGNFARFTGATTCGGVGGAMRRNLWSSATTGQLISPSTGNSTGGVITMTYDYKVAVWSANTVPQGAPWGTFDVQYGATATGPWTTVATETDETQVSACINKSLTFTAPAGPVFVRFSATFAGTGDYWLNFDNVSLSEVAAPCAGTPAPGNTVGPVGGACSGVNFTLSTQNATPGSGVGYQWYYGPSNTGPWLTLGTAAAQSISQTLDTWYYCDVTCGSATGSSSPVLVPMSVPTFPRDFEAGGIGGNCWSVSGTQLPFTSTGSGYGVGTTSAKFDFWIWSAGATAVLTSPEFTPTVAGTEIFFDVAGAQWSGDLTSIDQVTLEESADGGTTWTPVVVMDNSATGLLRTAAPSGGSFTPTASQWASLAFPLSTGTNRVRFVGLADFGNNVQLDNISVGVLPSARHSNYGVTCATGYAMTAAPAPIAGTTFTYSQVGIPEAAPASGIYFGVVVLSLGQDFAGTPLNVLSAGLIDSPCNLNVMSLDLLLSFVSGTPADSSVTFNVPAGAPAGFLVYSQAAALIVPVAPNNAGIVTSNAIRSYINNF